MSSASARVPWVVPSISSCPFWTDRRSLPAPTEGSRRHLRGYNFWIPSSEKLRNLRNHIAPADVPAAGLAASPGTELALCWERISSLVPRPHSELTESLRWDYKVLAAEWAVPFSFGRDGAVCELRALQGCAKPLTLHSRPFQRQRPQKPPVADENTKRARIPTPLPGFSPLECHSFLPVCSVPKIRSLLLCAHIYMLLAL